MSLCDPLPTASPLNYCGAAPYGPAVIHIGTLPDDLYSDGLVVILRNLATGRRMIVPIRDTPYVVDINHPSDLSPHTFYEIKVCAKTDAEGIAPVPFFPYVYDGVDWIVAYDTVDGVNVKFVKLFDWNGEVHSHEEQFITLA